MVKLSGKGESDGNCQAKQDGPGAGNFDRGMASVVGASGRGGLGTVAPQFRFLAALYQATLRRGSVPRLDRGDPHRRHCDDRLRGGLHPRRAVELDPPVDKAGVRDSDASPDSN